MASFSYDSQRQQLNLIKVYRAFANNCFCQQKQKSDSLCMKFLQPPTLAGFNVKDTSHIPRISVAC